MRDVITFAVPLPPRGLRVRLLHTSRGKATGYRARLVDEYAEAVWIAGWKQLTCPVAMVGSDHRILTLGDELGPFPWEYARLSLAWHHVGVAPDADNALASCKALIDVLHTRSKRPLGIVVDDSSDHLIIERVELRKVRHRYQEGIDVTITRLEDA